MADLEEVLKHYGVTGKVIGVQKGPLISQIKFEPAAGTKLKNIEASLEDIAREMGFKTLRISNTCGDNCIGFEIPNDTFETTDLFTILDSEAFAHAKGALPLNLGVDISGKPLFADLAKMPHLLVAGATGSGKSVGLNAFILSLMKAHAPKDLKFVLIDPKRIEFSVYNNQKYMYMPVVTNNEDASQALELLVLEMENRYKLFEESLTKNIEEYNQKEGLMAYIVAVVDEFSDLVLTNKAVEKQIQLLAQKARAAGIHLILATQRPSVDVVTGSIKANFPSRIAFKTASAVDSKTIIDTTGAQDLVGRGDALYLASSGELVRFHGAYASTEAIEAFLKPYRAPVKEMLKKENTAQNQEAPQKEKSGKTRPFFLIAWIIALWKWLGKREQKKIIKMIVDSVVKGKR